MVSNRTASSHTANNRTEVPTQREVTSLTQVSSASESLCPACGRSRLTHIALTLTDGSPVDFTSCHHCEHKAWVQDGKPLEIDVVLAKAKKHKL